MSKLGSLACGWTHTILSSDKLAIYGWGIGENGELGAAKGFVAFGANELPFSDFDTRLLRAPAQVACGSSHTVILANGKVYTMGAQLNGRLGHGRTHGQVVFKNQPRIVSIAAGADYTIAVAKGGKELFAWGLGTYGNLGDGDKKDRAEPVSFSVTHRVRDVVEVKTVVQVACGSGHTLAVCQDGDVFSWGYGANGRLGHGDQNSSTRPKRIGAFVLSAEQRIQQVACGDSHSMALSKEGLVYTWGSGSYGRLGLGAESDQYVPKVVDRLRGMDVTHVACNAFHSLAVVDPASRAESSLYTWGRGQHGRLGNKSTRNQNQLYPVEVPLFKKKSKRVINAQCGLHHTVAILADGHVYAWGYAARFRLGFDPKGKRSFDVPQLVKMPVPTGVVNMLEKDREAATRSSMVLLEGCQVAAGQGHSLALAHNGTLVRAWGQNSNGQLGTGFHKDVFKPIPVEIREKTQIIAIACGGYHSMAVTEHGSVYTWGQNNEGQLGVGDFAPRGHPTLVEALQGTRIFNVAAGMAHSCAIEEVSERPDCGAYVWGSNKYGQLGLGSSKLGLVPYPAPLQLPRRPGYHEVRVSCGETHSIILGIYRSNKGAKKAAALAAKRKNPYLVENDMRDIKATHVFTCGAGTSGQLGNNKSSDEHSLYLVTAWKNWREQHQDRGDDDQERLPKVKHVAAGQHCSMVVVFHERLQELYAFGQMPGVELVNRFAPERVQSFDHDQVQDMLGIPTSIHYLSFEQVVCASNHFMVLLRYNNDRKVVFSWGETKYGKLGVGNVAKFNTDRAEADANKNKSGIDFVLEDENDFAPSQDANNLPPSLVSELSDKDITMVAAAGDHSLAVSAKSGRVYAWGYGSRGRLGLGDDEESSNKSQQEPRRNPFFGDPQAEAAALEDDELGGADDGGHDGDDDDGNVGVDDDSEVEDEEELEEKERVAEEAARRAKEQRAQQRALGEDTDALLFLEEEEEDMVKLQAKYRPEERAQVIEMAREQIEARQEQYATLMEKYLQIMDEREHTEEIVDLAITARIEDAIAHSRTAKLHDDYKHRKLQEKFARGELEDFEEIVDDDDDAGGGGYELNEMERTVGRFYMAPCLFMDLYSNCSLFLRSNKLYDEGEKALRNDFVELLFSVYNIHYTADQRLLEVFILDMFTQHVHNTHDVNDILAEDSLEWLVFMTILQNGNYRRRVRDLLHVPLKAIAEHIGDDDEDPSHIVEQQMSHNPGKVEEAINTMVDLTNLMFHDLTTSSVNSIMSVSGWLVSLMLQAFERQNRPGTHIIGRRLIRALARVGLADLKHRRIREKKQRAADKIQLSAGTEEFVLRLLISTEEANKLLTAPPYAILENSIPKSVERFWDDQSKAGSVDAFVDYIKAAKTREKESAAGDGGAASAGGSESVSSVEQHRLLIRDFLIARSVYRRRIVQVPHHCRKLLIAFGYFGSPEDTHIRYTTGTTNLRLDLFHTDRHREVIGCDKCGVYHPPVEFPSAKADADEWAKLSKSARLEELDVPNVDENDTSTKVIIPSHICSSLWRTLKDRKFQKIVRTKAGEGAWKEIMRLLKRERQAAFEKKHHDAVERFEVAARYLRRIKDANPGTVVYLVSEEHPAIAEMVDPARLFDRLRRIDESTERGQMLSIRNVELYADVISTLRSEIKRSRREAEEMKQVFKSLTTNSQEADPDLYDFKKQHKSGAKVRSKVRVLDNIAIFKERGSIRRYTHQELYSTGVLELDPNDRRNRAEAFCCLPITWCMCVRTSQYLKNAALFFDKLEFIFLTTETDDIFELKIVYEDQLLVFTHVSLELLLGVDGDEDKKMLAMKRHISPTCHIVEYDPQGDRVPVTIPQTFVFDRVQLWTRLDAMARPHPRSSGGTHAQHRAKQVGKVLQVSDE